jgi:hypothetical protein
LNLPSKILSRFRFVFTGEKSIEIVINWTNNTYTYTGSF